MLIVTVQIDNIVLAYHHFIVCYMRADTELRYSVIEKYFSDYIQHISYHSGGAIVKIINILVESDDISVFVLRLGGLGSGKFQNKEQPLVFVQFYEILKQRQSFLCRYVCGEEFSVRFITFAELIGKGNRKAFSHSKHNLYLLFSSCQIH